MNIDGSDDSQTILNTSGWLMQEHIVNFQRYMSDKGQFNLLLSTDTLGKTKYDGYLAIDYIPSHTCLYLTNEEKLKNHSINECTQYTFAFMKKLMDKS